MSKTLIQGSAEDIKKMGEQDILDSKDNAYHAKKLMSRKNSLECKYEFIGQF